MEAGYPIWCPTGRHFFTVQFGVPSGTGFACPTHQKEAS